MKLKKSHKCENTICENIASKDKYGNYKRYCSDACKEEHRPTKLKSTYAGKDMSAILEKRKATNIAKYGVVNVAQTESVKEKLRITTAATAAVRSVKTKETNLKNYGVGSTNSLQTVKDKKKKTFIDRYGVDHQLKIPGVAASVSQKNTENAIERLAIAAQTKLKTYGDKNYNNREKYVETCLGRFGVENPSQNPVIHEKKIKNGYLSKQYIFPSGKIVNVQGWEYKALDELLLSYSEDDINIGTDNIPRITYYDNSGKKHYYFPDIYIPKDNLIIEVKSQWTYDKNIPRHHLKRDACIAAGYNFKFMIMGKK